MLLYPNLQIFFYIFTWKNLFAFSELYKAINFSKIMLIALTGKASGKAGSFPYKMVRKGAIEVEGLPWDVLPLHPPSHYGEEKLQSLLSCASISIKYV